MSIFHRQNFPLAAEPSIKMSGKYGLTGKEA
jgi:hypothetical protein